VAGDRVTEDSTFLPLPKRSNVSPEMGGLVPFSNATVLSVASGTTTATVSPAFPAEIIITGPASPFQSVFPEGPEGKTGGSDPRAESDMPRPLSRHATIVMSGSINKQ
jgi:hypothetical protein